MKPSAVRLDPVDIARRSMRDRLENIVTSPGSNVDPDILGKFDRYEPIPENYVLLDAAIASADEAFMRWEWEARDRWIRQVFGRRF